MLGLVSLLLIGLVLLGAGGPSGAQEGTTTIDFPAVLRIVPDHAAVGTVLAVSGTKCSLGDTVTFTIGPKVIGTAKADSQGRFGGPARVPKLEAGEYTVYASCGTNETSTTLTVKGALPGSGGGSGGLGATGFLAIASLPIFALIPAEIAGRKRRSRATYWLLGLIFPVGLVAALLATPRPRPAAAPPGDPPTLAG